MIIERVKENFIELKRSKGLTWKDFGKHHRTVMEFCIGNYKDISLTTYNETCEHLGYKPGYLMNKDLLKKG